MSVPPNLTARRKKLYVMMRAGYSKLLMLLTRLKLNLDYRRSTTTAVIYFLSFRLAPNIVGRSDNMIGICCIPEFLNLSIVDVSLFLEAREACWTRPSRNSLHTLEYFSGEVEKVIKF